MTLAVGHIHKAHNMTPLIQLNVNLKTRKW